MATLLLGACSQPPATPSRTATAPVAGATAVPTAVSAATPRPPTAPVAGETAVPTAIAAATSAATGAPDVASSARTFHTQISFDTYETEETIQSQLGRLPGVLSLNVTQLDVTVQYDPLRLSEADILRTLRANPEVRIKEDSHGP